MVLNGAQAAPASVAAMLVGQPVDMYPAPSMASPVLTQTPPAAVAQPANPNSDAIPTDVTQPAPQNTEPSGTYDGPPPDQPAPVLESSQVPPVSPYHCTPGRDAQATVANCVGHKHGHNGFWIVLVGLAIAVLIGVIINRTTFSSDNNVPADQALLEQGPQLPMSYPDGSLSIRAFTRDGWPIVVDFEPQPGTVTQLEVTTGSGHHRHSEKIVLDPDGSHGRQLMRVAMPDTGSATRPTPATYVVSSIPIATFDVEQPQAVGLAPLKIYGIGGGPHAVGSVAIEQLAFTPLQPGARFTYLAKSEFNRARAQVQQLQRAADGTIQIQPVVDFFGSNLSVGPHGGIWSGPETAAGPRVFRLQVTAWYTNDDRSWVAALAPDLITQ